MTGLNLEGFLHLPRADLGAWATLGLIVLILGLMAWTTWGSRRALRKCLVLSIVAHAGLALYGGTVPILLTAMRREDSVKTDRDRIRQIKVFPSLSSAREFEGSGGPRDRTGLRQALAPWDKPAGGLALADVKLTAPKTPAAAALGGDIRPGRRPDLEPEGTTPETASPASVPPESEVTRDASLPNSFPAPSRVAPGAPDEVPPVEILDARSRPQPDDATTNDPDRLRSLPRSSQVERTPARGTPGPRPPLTSAPGPVVMMDDISPSSTEETLKGVSEPLRAPLSRETLPDPITPDGGEVMVAEKVKNTSEAPRGLVTPESDLRSRTRPAKPGEEPNPESRRPVRPRRRSGQDQSLALSLPRVTPGGLPILPEIRGTSGSRPMSDVPEVYRSRLDPNRSARAFRGGASPASEQAVERALDWLARHQDLDGRWNGATARYDDGSTVKGDEDFTVHCPPGETCFGECVYWEADTALTGLALLSYLGAGYTQTDGMYADTVARGIDYLLQAQKTNGDLRGRSRAVGMYCHAMATIALCEAYALTGDERLRTPVERAIGFLVNSRARDGQAWRYLPGATTGDTSILGWVVMALKSAREVGIAIPRSVQKGTLSWLEQVSSGDAQGLARYQPWDRVTPTMTAEAWVCRQFLGVGGPSAASSEAAEYLLRHDSDRGTQNLYYWYYGTLAMYQHGGDAWYRWNSRVRDEIVRHQRIEGHPAGSWDPDDSPYGSKGGRIYCTALATLSLEVYYRYLRLYDDPKIPPALAPGHSPETRPKR
ncbi:MAG: hypothetical protein NVSMB9_03900 [Isosphaeraceae bacterium]